jgi:hypothetical protein
MKQTTAALLNSFITKKPIRKIFFFAKASSHSSVDDD